MRVILLLLGLLGAGSVSAAQFFIIDFEQGENWQPEFSYDNQPGLENHLAYWQEHYI